MSDSVEWLRERAQAFNLAVYKHKLLAIARELEAAQARLLVLETEHREFYDRATKAEAELALKQGEKPEQPT